MTNCTVVDATTDDTLTQRKLPACSAAFWSKVPLITDRREIFGNVPLETICTSHAERVNLTTRTLLKRFTLFLRDGVIESVIYPVFPPNRSAEQALARLAA